MTLKRITWTVLLGVTATLSLSGRQLNADDCTQCKIEYGICIREGLRSPEYYSCRKDCYEASTPPRQVCLDACTNAVYDQCTAAFWACCDPGLETLSSVQTTAAQCRSEQPGGGGGFSSAPVSNH